MKVPASEASSIVMPDGGELTYYAAGRGLPVLLCNGLGAPREVWRSLVQQLGDRYRFLSWDYRGLESTSAFSIDACAREALAILEAESITRASVIGWSIGVQVSLETFRMAPGRVASLVLINGGARVAWARGVQALMGRTLAGAVAVLRRAPDLVGRAVHAALRAPEAFTWARRVGLVGDQVNADTFTKVTQGFLRVDPAALIEALDRVAEHDCRDVLSQVDVPTLVIAGDRDPFTPRSAMERLVHGIAGAEYFLLPGATHYVLLDQAERVSLRIEKFWNERGYRAESRAAAPSTPPTPP